MNFITHYRNERLNHFEGAIKGAFRNHRWRKIQMQRIKVFSLFYPSKQKFI